MLTGPAEEGQAHPQPKDIVVRFTHAERTYVACNTPSGNLSIYDVTEQDQRPRRRAWVNDVDGEHPWLQQRGFNDPWGLSDQAAILRAALGACGRGRM
jgi:hypothetical protein